MKDINNLLIFDKYFLLEKDNRFPLEIPTVGWQNLSNESFNTFEGVFVYLLKANNIYYIGSGKKNRPSHHKSYLKRKKHDNSYMQNVVNKHGIKIFYFCPLIQIPLEYIKFRDQIENSYIKLFDTYNNGYNLCEFADSPKLGRIVTVETRKKISMANMGRISHNKGKKLSEKTKQKIRKARLGTKHSIEAKQRMSKIRKDKKVWTGDNNPSIKNPKKGVDSPNFGKKHNKKRNVLIGQKMKTWHVNNKHPLAKRVLCIETHIVYDSAKKATQSMGLRGNDVSKVCNGKAKTCGGFHWKYVIEDNK